MSLDNAQRKWARKAARGFQSGKWAKNFASPETKAAWAEGLADATGIPAGQIAASTPGKNFSDAQANASQFADKAARRIETAARTGKWARNFRRAFES